MVLFGIQFLVFGFWCLSVEIEKLDFVNGFSVSVIIWRSSRAPHGVGGFADVSS